MFNRLFLTYFSFTLIFMTKALAQEVKLLSGENGKAGVEVILPPNHKTYWRYVGDSGISPQFDFSASLNLQKCEVFYPSPAKFDDGNGGFSIGYKENVIFPLVCFPLDTSKPIQLALKLDYAICDKQCLPATGKASLVLTSQKNEALDKAFPQVPQKKDRLIEILSQNDQEMSFKIALTDILEVYVEGESEAWALPFPYVTNNIYRLKFEGVPPKTVLKDKILRFTVKTKASTFETEIKL